MTTMQVKPYSYLVLDIETFNSSPEAADRWMASCWRPETIGTWKAETVAKRLQEMYEKRKTQLALLEEAPCVLISLKSDTEFRALHCMEATAPQLVDGATVQGFASESDMLVAFRTLLNSVVVLRDGKNGLGMGMIDGFGAPLPPTEFVGHNIRDFDLPKLRTCYLCNDVQLPRALIDEVSVFDTMQKFCGRFAIHSNGFIGLDAILQILGLEPHKNLVDGSQIPAMVEAKEFDKIIKYGLLDVVTAENIYLRMAGKHPALK